MTRRHLALCAALLALACTVPAVALAQQHDHEHDHAPAAAPQLNFLGDENRALCESLTMQDFRGRMKPLDTQARELSMKITKRESFEGWEPMDLYMSWLANPEFWFEYPVLAVRFPGLKSLLGVAPETRWVSASSLLNGNQYVLAEPVREALRTPDRDRTKLQRQLLLFDERFNIFWDVLNGGSLRLYPIAGDPAHTWTDFNGLLEQPRSEWADRSREAMDRLLSGLRAGDQQRIRAGLEATSALQHQYGAEVLPSAGALKAELWLNKSHPFRNVTMTYLAAFAVLLFAFFWSLARRGGQPYHRRHPLYLTGMILFVGSLLFHLYSYVLRWIASGRAPLSNGYESLIFIALATAIAGLTFELRDRRGSSAGISALLTAVILAVAMLSTFDPAIGPLVPVLASYWLNIHVTIITGSYGFLGLGSLLGGLNLILFLLKSPRRPQVREAIIKLDRLLFRVLVTGVGLLSVGTLLGGVWANESWGRYWGWDPKETWSLVTILVYATVLHFRWIPAMNRPWVLATGGFAGIASVVMTYFGVNYFLSGLHSYAQGDAIAVPNWVYIGTLLMLGLIVASYLSDRFRRWE